METITTKTEVNGVHPPSYMSSVFNRTKKHKQVWNNLRLSKCW